MSGAPLGKAFVLLVVWSCLQELTAARLVVARRASTVRILRRSFSMFVKLSSAFTH